MQPFEIDTDGKVRKWRVSKLLAEELSSWIKAPPEEVSGAVLNPVQQGGVPFAPLGASSWPLRHFVPKKGPRFVSVDSKGSEPII